MADSAASADNRATEQDLVELVLNCPELHMLEAKLSQFNIFKALRADRNELRHSNMLAWLLDPEESHGLDDLFVRRWLMRVLNQAAITNIKPAGWISPVAVDVLEVERIEVHRELDNIDLLFTIHTGTGAEWTICIENKINSTQGHDQLARYHETVERRFSGSDRRLYVFLTKNAEVPAHAEFIPVTYSEVNQVLASCVALKRDAMAADPLLLIDHYQQLLAEDFVDESETNQLARQIYMRHRRALDFIFEHRVDPVYEMTYALEAALAKSAEQLGIAMERTGKGLVRFTPKDWVVSKNSGGIAWGSNSRYLLCEFSLVGKNAELHICSGRAPDDWADKLWARSAESPFHQEWKKRPSQFIKPYKAKSNISIATLADMDKDDAATRLIDWLRPELTKPKFLEAVGVLKELLNELP